MFETRELCTGYCPGCGETRQFKHLHDAAHGIPGTHMAGSERFVCSDCRETIYVSDPVASQFNFILDKP